MIKTGGNVYNKEDEEEEEEEVSNKLCLRNFWTGVSFRRKIQALGVYVAMDPRGIECKLDSNAIVFAEYKWLVL